ncbi:hypothetical protein [uncultured Tateyamaria sp.]|nr:hypothetical protein [uncultured Tateyamaria sp.]
MTNVTAAADDVFILGNLAAIAIGGDLELPCDNILDFLQVSRPNNAGAAILRALNLQRKGEITKAIEAIDTSNALYAEHNGQQAAILYTFLNFEAGNVAFAQTIAKSLLQQDLDVHPEPLAKLETIASQ